MIVANRIVCPVATGVRRLNGAYEISGSIFGTCFSIGGGMCLTAGHVVRELDSCSDNAVPLIGTAKDDAWVPFAIRKTEVLDADVGILRYSLPEIGHQDVPMLKWDLQNPGVLTSVRAIGYPYGIYTVDGVPSIVARAFQGTVVCTLPRFKPLGQGGPAFSVHELSFQAPRGLSGAPLLTEFLPPVVKGIIIGNSSTEMLVSAETESDSDGSIHRTVERVERLTLGVAVRAAEIAQLHSRLLGSTIGEHLHEMELLQSMP